MMDRDDAIAEAIELAYQEQHATTPRGPNANRWYAQTFRRLLWERGYMVIANTPDPKS
jgi:hypothetical protein